MAQIIKHRRGSLESVSAATKRAGELLVVTGSSGITAANGDSLLFVGIDGSTVTPSNKFLLGATAPDLTGASYDTSVDGIPFYDTGSEKLYILRKGGNLEVKATANTNGTGIVSSSAQIDTLGFLQVNGDAVVSSSAQIVSLIDSQDVNLGGVSGSSLDITGNAKIDGNLVLGGNITIGDATSDTITFGGEISSDIIPSANNTYDLGSATDKFAEIHATTLFGSISATNGVVSGSSQTIAHLGGSGVVSSSAQVSSFNTFLEIDGDGVHSGSGQVVDALLNQATDFGTGRVSGDNFGDAAGTSTFTGSFVGDGSGLTGLATNLVISSSDDGTNDSLDLLADALNFAGTSNEIEITVDSSTNKVQVGIVENPTLTGNVTITGDLQVQGTTTTIDSTTVNIGDNIIELNGTGAAFGGLMIGDVTAPNQVSGSLLWDATNDYWIAGASGSESKVLLASGDGVVSGSAQVKSLLPAGTVSGSSQVDADTITNFDSNVKDKLNADGVISGSAQITDGSGIVSSSAQVSAFGVFAELNGDNLVSSSAQVVSLIDSQDVNLGGISGSSLDITGNAKIDGNLVLGGNITIGDQSTDTISFGGEISSDVIPDTNNTHDLGSASKKFAEVHATTLFGSLSATNGVISGSSQLDGTTLGASSGIVASGSFSGSFVGDGSGLTGLVSDLRISGSTGNDTVSLLNDDLLITGSGTISAAVTNNTITLTARDASTSVKGVASFDADDFSVSSGNVSIKSNGVRAANLNADVAGTGISLNGVDNSIEVDYGSTAGTAVEGNTTITVNGTANEIEITGTAAQALGGGASYTIGLPDSVTIATASIQDNLSVGGNLTVTGNLSVLGTTTTIDSTTVQIGDNILELNIGGAQSTAGLQVTDATAPNTVSGSLLWDGTNDYWKAGALGSEKELARLNADPTSNTVLKADANGLLVDSLITDDGTNVTISGTAELRINAATANSFVFFDANKSLEAVTPSNAGDVIQWNGTSFVASNELDGGTF